MSVDVVVSELRKHATALYQLSADGEQAVAAGRYVSAQGEAFGVLCAFVGESIAPVQDMGVQAASSAASSVAALGDAVRAVADLFEKTDELIGDAFDYLKG